MGNIMILKDNINEIREIIFWHKLNKQLFRLKEKEQTIKKNNHSELQKFCFKNDLYAKVTESSVSFGIPLSLITDFKRIFFITVGLRSWTNLLTKLLPNTYALNIDKALTEVFDDIVAYDRKYNVIDNLGTKEDADEELYDFIQEYLAAKESAGIDLPSLILKSHRLKLMALKKIMNNFDFKNKVVVRDNKLFINTRENLKIDKINKIYINVFCNKSNPRYGSPEVKWIINMNKSEDILLKKLEERALKDSIKDFINNELPVCRTEIKLIRNFSTAINHRINAGIYSEIPIFDINSFTFLKNPLPLV